MTEDKKKDLPTLIASKQQQIEQIMPGDAHISAEQLVKIAQVECVRNPALLKCDPTSVLMALYDTARLGLMLGREAHLVPYKTKCQMIPDFRGFITKALASGLVSMIDADVVFPQDVFKVRRGSAMELVHEPDYEIDRTDTGAITHVYAVAWLKDSPVPVFLVLNRKDVERVRSVSKMKDGIPWTQWWDKMAMKTAIKHLVDKRLPLTKQTAISDMIELDNRAESGNLSRPTSWEDKADIQQSVSDKTRERAEDIAKRLAPAGVDTATGEVVDGDAKEPEETEEERVRREDKEAAAAEKQKTKATKARN